MAKPNKTPEWAHGPDAEILEPSLGRRLTGWIVEPPPHQFFNWLFNLIGQWLGFVDSQFADDGVKRVQRAENIAALKLLTPNDGDTARVAASVYTFDAASIATGNDVLVVEPASGVGRWLHTAQAEAGKAHGLASLHASGRVFDSQLGRGEANGVAALGSNSKVPDAQLGRGTANGVASLDANSKVMQEPATKGLPGGVAALQPDGGMRATSTNPTFAGVVGIGESGADGVEGRSDTGVGGRFRANASRGAINIAYGFAPVGGEVGDVVFAGGKLQVCVSVGPVVWMQATLTAI